MKFTQTLVKDWPALLILLAPFVLLAIFWGRIPETVPTHWGIDGEADGFSTKGASLFLLPLISIGVYLLLVAVPYIDPKGKSASEQKAMRAFRWFIPLLMTAIFVMMLVQWLGTPVDIGTVVFIIMSVMFMVLGNYMQTLKPNYFVGLRTPWTLESEDIWRKTHRLGGRLWVAGGLVLLALIYFFSARTYFVIYMVGVAVMAIVPMVYSFVLYLREKEEATRNEGMKE